VVRECTLAVATLLEAIDSPLVTGRKAETMMEMLPTMFVMTRPAAESMRILADGVPALKAAAVAWADTMAPGAGHALAIACAASARRVSDVSPQGVPGQDAGNASAAATAGS
jgi:hypothetical protein